MDGQLSTQDAMRLAADALRAAAEEYSVVYRQASAAAVLEVYDFLHAKAAALSAEASP